MNVELLYFDGCPHWTIARDRLRTALDQLGLDPAMVTFEQIGTPEDAERRGFRGSPTILIEGRDPFAQDTDQVGLACRVYRTDETSDGVPSVAELVAALS